MLWKIQNSDSQTRLRKAAMGNHRCYINESKTAPAFFFTGQKHQFKHPLKYQKSNFYISICFEYSPNKLIFSHLEPKWFAHPMRLCRTPATDENQGYREPKSLLPSGVLWPKDLQLCCWATSLPYLRPLSDSPFSPSLPPLLGSPSF